MRTFNLISSVVLLVVLSAGFAPAQQSVKLGDNAALRYWSAFAQMQDAAITDQQAAEVNLILDGAAAYSDVAYKELVEKNRPALDTMARATALATCDWGVDTQLGADAPVDYVRRALALGRINVLYAFHLLSAGDKDGAVRALASGVRFSRDVANGGTLFATVVAKDLLSAHLKALTSLAAAGLSATQRLVLRKALSPLPADALDWPSAVRRELEVLQRLDAAAPAALARIVPSYVGLFGNPSELPGLQQTIANAPQPLRDAIPNPTRVLEERQDLAGRLQRTRALLQ
jgi:hypothetical protein